MNILEFRPPFGIGTNAIGQQHLDSPTPTNPNQPNFAAFYKRQQSNVPKELCEKLGRKVRRAGLIRDHQQWTLAHGMMVYKNAFKGEDFIRWLMREQNLSREEAVDKGQWLVEHRVVEQVGNSGGCKGARTPTTPTPTLGTADFIGSLFGGGGGGGMFASMGRSFSSDRYYKLVDDDYEKRLPLNAPDECLIDFTGAPRTPVNVREFNRRFCELAERIYAAILSEDKRRVHLDLLDECETFAGEYVEMAREMANLDIGGASEQDRLALFINLHNMMLIHITYKYGMPGTVWQRRKYLYSTYYTIGGHLYSLQSIFNGILRGNRKGLGMLWKPFGEQDLRNQFVIRGGEPLVHFGLNNYTRSTPPIRVYSTENLREELRANARECLRTQEFLQIDLKGGKLLLANMFKQYSEDFGPGQDDTLKWLVRVLEPSSEERSQLAKLLHTRSYSLAFLPMDNDLNMSYGVPLHGQQQQTGNGTAAGLDGGQSGNGTGGRWTKVSTGAELQEEGDLCED